MAETGSKFLLSSKSDSAYLLQHWIPNGYGVNLNSRLCFDFGTATENASKSTSYTHKVREMRVPEIEQNLLCAGHKGHLRHRIYCESTRIFRFRRKGHIVRIRTTIVSWLLLVDHALIRIKAPCLLFHLSHNTADEDLLSKGSSSFGKVRACIVTVDNTVL